MDQNGSTNWKCSNGDHHQYDEDCQADAVMIKHTFEPDDALISVVSNSSSRCHSMPQKTTKELKLIPFKRADTASEFNTQIDTIFIFDECFFGAQIKTQKRGFEFFHTFEAVSKNSVAEGLDIKDGDYLLMINEKNVCDIDNKGVVEKFNQLQTDTDIKLVTWQESEVSQPPFTTIKFQLHRNSGIIAPCEDITVKHVTQLQSQSVPIVSKIYLSNTTHEMRQQTLYIVPRRGAVYREERKAGDKSFELYHTAIYAIAKNNFSLIERHQFSTRNPDSGKAQFLCYPDDGKPNLRFAKKGKDDPTTFFEKKMDSDVIGGEFYLRCAEGSDDGEIFVSAHNPEDVQSLCNLNVKRSEGILIFEILKITNDGNAR
ncbi:uncharacterized protein LOC141901970 [Tubulanus polymorphus]|uniref:uncharacterized protein LOC141901970 n=1 Tax=Tubulanus polymorphus TaxID=672921 RepID=UPI003DA4C4A4